MKLIEKFLVVRTAYRIPWMPALGVGIADGWASIAVLRATSQEVIGELLIQYCYVDREYRG